jgi:arylsulfatase
VAAQQPKVVERLRKLIAKMDADLGTNKLGPGVRAPGRVANPVGLWLPGQAPALGDGLPPSLETLKLGDTLSGDDAPEIAGKPLTITCEVEAKSANGVIVAQGGAAVGYAVYLRDGRLQFTVREARNPVSITASETPSTPFRLEARLARDGAMTLAVDGRTVAHGKAPGIISHQPTEDFCVGHDNHMPVGDYVAPAPFAGTIQKLKITND